MELLGLGAIAAGFSIYLAIPGRIRRKRRKELGLPKAIKTKAPSGVDEEDWRRHAPPWSDPKFYHRYGRRGP